MTDTTADQGFADLEITQKTVAIRFGDEYCDRARFDHHSGYWYIWDGRIWRKNEDQLALHWAGELCLVFGMESPELAKELGRYSAIAGVEKLARSDRRLAITSEVFDRDPWLMGTPGGTLDLRDGSLRQSDQGDMITRMAGCTPAGEDEDEPELWLRFLHDATQGDAALIRYLQVVCGYCLTGRTIEQALFFAYGKGGNGKSVFINVLRAVMGSYAAVAPMGTFMAKKFEPHPTDLAGLAGARLVTASETGKNRAWDESRIKGLTGGDPVPARFMHKNFFTYIPIFKLFFIGNHKPKLESTDEAMRRRLQLIPFLFKPPTKDLELENKLRAELPRIFRWMINGCIDWQAEGIPNVKDVAEATKSYFADQDLMGQWMDEACEIDPEGTDPRIQWTELSSTLFGSWSAWCKLNGEDPGSNMAFSQDLENRGFEKKPSNAGKKFHRIHLKPKEKKERADIDA